MSGKQLDSSPWPSVRLGAILSENKQIVRDTWEETLLLSLTLKGVIPRDMENRVGKLPESFSTYQKVNRDDLIFCLFDVEETPRTIGLAYADGMVTSAYTVMRAAPSCDPRFVAYSYLRFDQEKSLKHLYAGLRNTIRRQDFKNIRIPLPDRETQEMVADYLDRETTEIDAFIADCSSMVSILEEQESAFAASLLTHGLNSSVSVTKNHGMLWLEGESIPSHWTRMKLGFLVRMKSGDAISSEDIEAEGSYPVFGGGGFRGYTSTSNITGAHVLIGRQGALCGKVFISEGDAFATEHAIVTYPKIDLDLRWLEGLLRFMNLGQYSQSAAQPGIGVESISKLYVPVPPISERIKIGDSLRRHQEKKSALLLELKSAIILAHERRSALISAAVTGQIEVSAQGVSAADHLRDELEVHV